MFYVFTHILQHFYKGGIGLRQICDWCRLLWTCRETIDSKKLETRLKHAKLLTAWKAFAALAIEYLGMPVEAMPLFNENDNHNHKPHRKAERIKIFVLQVGNIGCNRDSSYFGKAPVCDPKGSFLWPQMWRFGSTRKDIPDGFTEALPEYGY